MHLESMSFKANCPTVSLGGLGGVHPSNIHSNAPMR